MYAYAIPVPPGKTDMVRRFFADVLGPRNDEYVDQCRRAGIGEEAYWLQSDPDGDTIVVAADTDPTAWAALVANPETEFDRWVAEQLLAIWGPSDVTMSRVNESLGRMVVNE